MRVCEYCDGDGFAPGYIIVGETSSLGRKCVWCVGTGIQLVECRACGTFGRGVFCSRYCFDAEQGGRVLAARERAYWRALPPPRYQRDAPPADAEPINYVASRGTFQMRAMAPIRRGETLMLDPRTAGGVLPLSGATATAIGVALQDGAAGALIAVRVNGPRFSARMIDVR